MVFNRTSCGSRSARGGFTLAEYMVGMSVGLLVMAAAMALWAFGSRTCAALFSYVELSSMSKFALDRVSQQIRNASRVEGCAVDRLVISVPPDTGTGTVQVIYAYNKTNQTFTQTMVTSSNKQVTTLLTGCTNFQFAVYQRTPQYNSSALITNAWSTNTAKVVEMRWTCVRKLTGDKNNIETQASAKVVMRNR